MSNIEENAKEEFWTKAQNKGEILYNRYCSWVDYESFNGDPLKSFAELPEKIRYAWIMASIDKTKDNQ